MDRQMEKQTNQYDFIGCSLTNVEHPKIEDIKKEKTTNPIKNTKNKINGWRNLMVRAYDMTFTFEWFQTRCKFISFSGSLFNSMPFPVQYLNPNFNGNYSYK